MYHIYTHREREKKRDPSVHVLISIRMRKLCGVKPTT